MFVGSNSLSSGPVRGDCDFECGPCFWNNTLCDQDNWVLQEGDTPSFGTGSATDHTYGTSEGTVSGKVSGIVERALGMCVAFLGHYMYFESSLSTALLSRASGDRAILESPNIQGSIQACTMTFYYHMFGLDIGSLLIYSLSDTSIQLLMNVTGNQGNQWNRANVTVVSVTDYRVHLVATYGNGYRGDIAIDDISFKGCSFSSRKDNTYCPKRKDHAVNRA